MTTRRDLVVELRAALWSEVEDLLAGAGGDAEGWARDVALDIAGLASTVAEDGDIGVSDAVLLAELRDQARALAHKRQIQLGETAWDYADRLLTFATRIALAIARGL